MANTYRITKVSPSDGNAAQGVAAAFIPEFSQNAGTTWTPVQPIPYQSLQESKQKLANIVANEANFNKQVLAGHLVPVVTHIAYP